VRTSGCRAGGPPHFLPALLRDAARLGLSTLSVGVVLYALAPGSRPAIGHAIAAGVALLLWCYCDGMIGRLDWGLAALEALLRLRLALAWVEVLFEASGSGSG
jgi:hypothetical protein